MDIEQRIQNFKKMADDDPGNELGHFSLGKAYLEAARHEEARECFERVIELNGEFSKAYQHLAEVLIATGRKPDAIDVLTRGYGIAARRGDNMPRDAMGRLLSELGAPVPAAAAAAAPPRPAPAAAGSGVVSCSRCGRVAPAIPERPFKGPLGEQVLAHTCAACWAEWVAMGTKVINELRLDFSNPMAGDIYDAHMKEFLQLPE